MSRDYDDTTEARRRFYMLANLEQRKQGLPPIPEPAPELPPAMRKFVSIQRGGATQDFIAMNAERLNRGLPPLGANGQPIMPQAAAAQPPPQQTDPATEAFFKGQTDFEGRPNPEYANIPVKRYNS